MERFVEDAPIVSKRKTSDGYLVADVRCARTGTQEYLGFELGQPTRDRVTVYRPEEVVFDRKTFSGFANKPVTDNHPSEAVTADNWRNYARGTVGADVVRDGEFVRVPLMVTDADLIAKIEAGKREISMGYVMALDWTPGKTPDGKSYDAIMTGMRINHAAIVDRGRAGSDCRIGDSAEADEWGAAPIHAKDEGPKPMATKMIVFDGLPIETTDAGEAAIRRVEGKLADAAKVIEAKDTAIATKDAAHKTEIEAKDAEIKRLTGLIPAAGDIAKMVADRSALETTAKAIDPKFVVDSKASNDDIRKAIVTASFGEAAVKDATPEAISGMFYALGERTKTPANDGFRLDRMANPTNPVNVGDSQSKYEDRIANAWKDAK